MTHHTAEHRSPQMNDCISSCMDCHAICLETITYCLEKGGQHATHEHIALLSTCADICATSADAMLLGTEVHRFTCGACAEICRRCGDACEGMGDPEMMRCVEACRRCADSCAAMAA